MSRTDAVAEVGDEALACARSLAALPNARVVVGQKRQSAIDHAAALEPGVDVVVIDGPLQLAPSRASLSVLALDAAAPWGAGALAPAGDLRAPPAALLAHADHVVFVDATPRGAFLGGSRRSLDLASLSAMFAGARVGVFTALARPERLLRALARAGIGLSVLVRAADHGPVTSMIRSRLVDSRVDLWLATAKCATHLEGLALGSSLAILDGSLVLPAALRRGLDGILGSAGAIAIHP